MTRTTWSTSSCALRCRKTASFRLTSSLAPSGRQHQQPQKQLQLRAPESLQARPIQLRLIRALVRGHSGGNVIPQLKLLSRVLVQHRFLISTGLSLAAGIVLRSIVLIPIGDPLFRYSEIQRPAIYHAFVWSYIGFLFTTPFLVLSVCFSLVYIHFYEEETRQIAGGLPEYPEPQYRHELSVILGELHQRLEP